MGDNKKEEQPFSILFGRTFSNKDPDSTVYTDNLFSRDQKKYNRLCLKHFGDKGQTNWYDRKVEDIEAFLSDWFDRGIEVVQIESKKHQVQGYPLWKIDFVYTEE